MLAQIIYTPEYGLARLMDQWWQWPLLAVVCVAILVFVVTAYLRDGRELSRGATLSLLLLRVFAFGGLLCALLGPERRIQQDALSPSRVVLLLDASQSMGLDDSDTSLASAGVRRIDLVVRELTEGTLLGDLRQRHELLVARFDGSEVPVELVSYPKLSDEAGDAPTTAGVTAALGSSSAYALETAERGLLESRWLVAVSGVLLLVSLIAGVTYVAGNTRSGMYLLVSVTALVGATVFAAIWNLRHPEIGLAAVLGQEDVASVAERIAERDRADDAPVVRPEPPAIDWKQKLIPAGDETRMAEALISTLHKYASGSLAAVVLVSDGQSNAGLPLSDAMLEADADDVPLYTIGMGSKKRPTNVAVVDVEAPSKVHPHDRFHVTGFLQSFGDRDHQVRVELVSRPEGEQGAVDRFEDETLVRVTADGKLAPVKFELEPEDEASRRVYAIRIDAPQGDSNPHDNAKTATVEVVTRPNRVLLFAGGPAREFRFLRNQLFRDQQTELHVFLQTGQPGISQEADEILYEFPEDPSELSQYDCIVAFDPNWQDLSEDQIAMVERWVDEQAGGLIVVAGPVFTKNWAAQRRGSRSIDLLKGLYPVVFVSRGTSLGLSQFGAEETSTVEFTRDGLNSEFLWLADTADESFDAWQRFEGVYGYYAVQDVKPGATVFARLAGDVHGTSQPIYMAGQYYGGGRVFFLASAEMWRIRKLDDTHFHTFYTKLIRWAGGGRLLRDSQRGELLVDGRRHSTGDSITVRAQLFDAQRRPLKPSLTPEVMADVEPPRGEPFRVKLRSVATAGVDAPGREGLYAGQFTAARPGRLPTPAAYPGYARRSVTRGDNHRSHAA